MEVIAIFEQLYFQPVKQIAYCHVTCAQTGDRSAARIYINIFHSNVFAFHHGLYLMT